MDVVVWLRTLGLGQYEAAFRENEINERVLPSLTQEDLKELGVAALGHRRMLLDAIAALRTDASGKAPSADAPSPSVSPEDRAERRQGVMPIKAVSVDISRAGTKPLTTGVSQDIIDEWKKQAQGASVPIAA
jgi:hypothetical protein